MEDDEFRCCYIQCQETIDHDAETKLWLTELHEKIMTRPLSQQQELTNMIFLELYPTEIPLFEVEGTKTRVNPRTTLQKESHRIGSIKVRVSDPLALLGEND